MPKKSIRNPRNAGRKPLPDGDVRAARAVCWLRPEDKITLAKHAIKSGQSESDILREGLRAIGVLPKEGKPAD
jgi:hypothetical protein